MNHYTDFDPYLIRERNEQIRREVKALQLGKQLRKRRNPHGLWMTTLGEWLRALIGGAKLAQSSHRLKVEPGLMKQPSESASVELMVQVGYMTLHQPQFATVPGGKATPRLV